MLRTLALILGSLVVISSSAAAAERVVLRPEGPSGHAVELFVAVPKAGTKHPAILFVHGHQESPRVGGREMADNGGLDRIAFHEGYVAASVSQPGYGGSDGPPDYCGPATQRAIHTALAYVRELPEVDPSRIALYGVSRGAIASSIVAANEPSLRALILIAGTYDLAAAYPVMPGGIRGNIEQEAGVTPEAFAARSALHIADRIRAATLILHGRYDDRAPATQAEALAKALKAHGTEVSIVLFESGHVIPFGDRQKATRPFLSRVIGQQ